MKEILQKIFLKFLCTHNYEQIKKVKEVESESNLVISVKYLYHCE